MIFKRNIHEKGPPWEILKKQLNVCETNWFTVQRFTLLIFNFIEADFLFTEEDSVILQHLMNYLIYFDD
jgi:hypothetical protein